MPAKRKPHLNEAARLYQQGLSIQEIATFYGVSRQSMWASIRRRVETMRGNIRQGEDNHFFRGGQRMDKRAGHLVEQAVAKGLLKRSDKCSACGHSGLMKDGRSSIHGHHSDYNKPLEVTWLCQRCHHEWHKKNRAKPLRS